MLSVTCYMFFAIWIFSSETCYYFKKLVPFARCCTSRNFFNYSDEKAQNHSTHFYFFNLKGFYWKLILYFQTFYAQMSNPLLGRGERGSEPNLSVQIFFVHTNLGEELSHLNIGKCPKFHIVLNWWLPFATLSLVSIVY